jgi:hypothetical protein
MLSKCVLALALIGIFTTKGQDCKYDSRCGDGYCLKYEDGRFVCSPTAEAPKVVHERWVPVNCISRLVIHDWGKCKNTGDDWDCPAAHMSFTVGCTSVKDTGKQGEIKIIRHPTAVLMDDSN